MCTLVLRLSSRPVLPWDLAYPYPKRVHVANPHPKAAHMDGDDGDQEDGEHAALLLRPQVGGGGGAAAAAAQAAAAASKVAVAEPSASHCRWYNQWRYRIALTAAMGEAIVYGQRIAVPLALVRMQAELGWDKKTQGVVMTGFWLGYAAMQIPGGWLTTRWGARRVVGAGLLASSVMHLLMPSAAVLSAGAMTALRVLQGVSQGVMVPGYAVLWGSWAPISERSRLSSIPQIGGYVGTIVQLVLGGWQIDLVDDEGLVAAVLGGWQAVFVLNAVLGLVWIFGWFACVYDAPKLHARVSVDERELIERSQARELEALDAAAAAHEGVTEEVVQHSSCSCALYRRMLRSKPVWAICCASFCHNTGNYMLIDGFPAYMRDVAGASMTSAGVASALPQLALAVLTAVGAMAADWLRGPRVGLSTGAVRRLMHTSSTACNALLLALVGAGVLEELGPNAIVAVLTLAVGVAGITVGGGFNVNHLDVLPTAAGLLLGVVNMCGSVAGAIAPYAMSSLSECMCTLLTLST
eukprot:COSAG01_NODE_5459_length_4253_cov_13.146606_1_plen_523_part_00